MRDVVYYFDKLSPYARHELGEIQVDFNMSLTIDGTKDSTKIVVRSFNGQEVEPYTILKHEKTNTWWVAINDNVQRYANESGFVYVHTIQCNGARELLNARDLTDIGFNSNRYTIAQFLERLVKLSKWDFPNVSFVYGNNIEYYNYVSFVKTFENYTLLSAIREFLDAYNCDFKLTFDQYANGRLYNAYITIIPKTGNVDLHILEEDEFKDVREIKKIDKNNFGTTVVSNAENVISSVAKTYPSQGSVRLSASEYKITAENACLRLPSNVYKVNWLKMYYNVCFRIWDTFGNNQPVSTEFYIFVSNKDQIDNFANTFEHELRTWLSRSESWYQSVISAFNSQLSTIIEKVKQVGVVTFYEGNSLNPVDATIVQGSNVPYIPIFNMFEGNKQVILTDKDTRNCLPLKKQGIYWTRGSDLIQGFDFLGKNSLNGSNVLVWDTTFNYTSTDYRENTSVFFQTTQDNDVISLEVKQSQTIAVKDISFACNYIPMSDLKIEIDNQRSTKDIQLYNQNGRLVDSVALSKILNSYSREISSNKITKYMTYYDFASIPKAGQMVKINNELYVINNVSIDFYANENDSYYMPCEFNLCKYVSTKSLMVNPNTNIRDYGIPQNFNVKRKQLYRDYLEFDYTQDSNADGIFYCKTIPLNFDTFGYTPTNHIVAFECEYENQVDGSRFWDYQLETTIYKLDKMQIELLDFKDNNIIGYGSQNTHSAFQVSRIFRGLLDTINTPISYVDENGEVKGFTLCWATQSQIETAWEEYKISEGYAGNTDYDLSNFSVFVPAFIPGSLEQCDMILNEDDYYKDATEVPVFEYVFQIGDSDNVLIGDKILDNVKNTDFPTHNIVWFYGFVQANAGTLNQNNALINSKDVINGFLEDMVIIDDLYDDELYFQLVNTQITPTANKDYAIYRIEYDLTMNTELQRQLVMVLKNVPSSAIIDGEIRLYKNKYKLK